MTTIQFQSATGRSIKITVSAEYGIDSHGVRKTSGSKSVEVVATVDGQAHDTWMGVKPVSGHPTAVAVLGQIGLTGTQLAELNLAMTAADDSIHTHNAAIKAKVLAMDALGGGDINKTFGSHC